MIRRLASFLPVLAVLGASSAAAQFPPERTKNLKVLPADLPVRAVIDTMRSFTRALGVRCTYCHVGEEGQDLAQYDFESDEKPAKVKAREMLRMVAAINGEHLAKLTSRREPAISVSCATCHRGVSEPRPLQQLVLSAYDAAGADSAEAAYRALRQRYHGRAAYDFGEVALADVGAELRGRGKLPDALRFYLLNVEFAPTSGFALRQAAAAQVAAGDTAGAVKHLERALAANPQDEQATRALAALRK